MIPTIIFALLFGALCGGKLGYTLARGTYVSRGLQAILLILNNLTPAERVTLITRIRETNGKENSTKARTGFRTSRDA